MVFLLFLIIHGLSATKIALFPSTGCFSHDVMMKQVGEQLDENSNNITWVQTYLYEFGFGEMPISDKWNRISIKGIDERGDYLQENTGRLIWKQNVPFDFDRPFNIQGIKDFILMLQRHQEYCTIMMDDPRYRQLQNDNITVAVLDHFLQECMGNLANMLNASVIQFSNWPISDGYSTSLNLPSVPSSYAKTGTRLPSSGMSFFQRCQNVLFHIAIVVTRVVQMTTLDALFASRGYPMVKVENCEAKRPIFAGRSELLFEPIRVINNRIKFFGAASTLPPSNYISSSNHLNNPALSLSITNNILHNTTNNLTDCQPTLSTTTRRRSWIFDTKQDRKVILARQNALHAKYTTLDWNKIHNEKFILVTFGSVAQVDKMDQQLLQSVLTTFGKRKENIIWTSNLSKEDIQERHNITVPNNVMVSSWVPIKELLAHENIEYIICHGGINTVNELALFGVPVLGVPLQGDQASNLARIVDLGSAELMTTIELNNGKLDEMMDRMAQNIHKYWKRSEQLAKMLEHHREFHTNYQHFWLNWVARNGKKIEEKRYMRYEYLGYMENNFWMSLFGIIILLIGISCK